VGDLTHTTVNFPFLASIVVLATGGIILGNFLNNKMDGAKLKKGLAGLYLRCLYLYLSSNYFLEATLEIKAASTKIPTTVI